MSTDGSNNVDDCEVRGKPWGDPAFLTVEIK